MPDAADDFERQLVTAKVVDGYGKAVAGEPPRDGAAEPAGATGHECDALLYRKRAWD